MLHRRCRQALPPVALTLALAVSGCGARVGVEPTTSGSEPSTSPSASPTSSSPSATTSPSASASPSESASPVVTTSPSVSASISPSPTVSSGTSQAGPRRLPQRLLTAAELPGFNARYTWQTAATHRSEGADPFGTCHKFAMTSIGAMKVVRREFAPTADEPSSEAGHLVAEFADRKTARRVFEVLKSWRAQCQEQLAGYENTRVGSLQPVPVPSGEAGWYLLTYGPEQGADPDSAYFDAQGLALVGSRIAVLEMRLLGQDYNYPVGREPMVAAVKRAAAKLG